MLGLVAYVAYRKHRKNKKNTQELVQRLAELIRALAEDTDTDFKTLAYDEELLQLIGSDAEYEDLVEYVNDNYFVIGHA
jgi:hypothetical protein